MKAARFVVTALLAACTGAIGQEQPPEANQPSGSAGAGNVDRTAGSGPKGGNDVPITNAPARPDDQEPLPALVRLSRREIEATVVDVFGVAGLALKHLPPDKPDPFDTIREHNETSAVFAEGIEGLATELAATVAGNGALLTRLAGCTPSGAGDEPCLRALTAALGRRLWRRPVDDAVTSSLVSKAAALAKETSSFTTGARLIVAALMESPAFAHRIEIGAAVAGQPGLRRLDNHEIASRLAFLLTGAGPDPALLDAAAGPPFDAPRIAALAGERWDVERAHAQTLAFHRMWIGYDGLRVPDALTASMLRETDGLIRKVLVTDRRAWTDLFTTGSTLVDAPLAKHYGLSMPAAETGWVDYGAAIPREGILSHASFLSLAARKLDDTSPVIRGKYVATRLLCRVVPKPPADVDADMPPEQAPGACKTESYAAHRQQGSACNACHKLMDPVGFGLERYDGLGRYRTVEKDNDRCPISGDGELDGVGRFNGISELVDRMLSSGELTSCGVRQYVRFAAGGALPDATDALVRRLHAAFARSGFDYRALVMGLLADPVFTHRREM